MVNLQGIARHEASHAFVAWYYGLRIKHVGICFDPLKTEERQGFCSASPVRRSMSAEEVLYILAGAVCDERNLKSLQSADIDFDLIKSNFRLSGDVLKMHEFFKEHPRAHIQSFYNTFKRPVERLLQSRKAKRCIKALADELLQHNTVCGKTVVSIFEKAWGNKLPPLALPVSEHGNFFSNKISSFDDLTFRLRFYLDAIEADIKAYNVEGSDDKQLETLRKALLQMKFVLTD